MANPYGFETEDQAKAFGESINKLFERVDAGVKQRMAEYKAWWNDMVEEVGEEKTIEFAKSMLLDTPRLGRKR